MKTSNSGRKKIKVKNYCICKIKGNVLWRTMDCPAKFVHNGKRSTTFVLNEINPMMFDFREEFRP